MAQMRGLLKTARLVSVSLCYFGLALMTSAHALASGQALVIGESAYASLPALTGCTLSAHAVTAALRHLGFTVDEQDDSSNGALYAAIGTLSRKTAAAPLAPVFVYFCGYMTSFNDRPFVLPVSASVSRPADALSQGLLAKTLLDAARTGETAAGVLVLDAVPLPNGPSGLSLDALTGSALPPALGYIAAVNGALGNTPTPLASALVPLLRDQTMESASLLSDIRQQLAGLKTATVAAIHLPQPGVDLVGAPAPPARAVAAEPARPPPAALSPPASAAGPQAGEASAPTSAPSPSLPAEDQMSDDQRRLVQRALARLGYYDAKPDGVFGPETRAAIRRWQHELHAPMTGHLTAEEASKLAASWG